MIDWLRNWPRDREIGRFQHLTIFVVLFILLAARRADALLHAQFWAEDGPIWYAEAYNLGWFHALFRTWAGSFQLVPRLAAALALLVPLLRAPLVMNAIAIAVHSLPVNILLSSRSSAWGTLRFRMLLAASYVALPIGSELRFPITNTQWILVLSALFLVVGAIPRKGWERTADVLLLLLFGFTGPFCFFLLPIAIFMAYRSRERWRWVPVALLTFSFLMQAWALLFLSPRSRGSGALGTSTALFVRILGGNVFLDAIFGAKPFAVVPGTAAFLLLLLFATAGLIFSAWMFVRAGTQMKMFCVLAALVFAASVISPTIAASPGTTRWQLLAEASGLRYWYLPALAFVWLLLEAVRSSSRVLRGSSATILVVLVVCMVFQWKHAAFRNLNFAEEAARFEAARPGEVVIIPENPDGWSIRLVKHAPSTR